MKDMDQKLKNAFYINFTNLVFSEAMKLAVIITFLIASVFSFWPWIHKNVFGAKDMGNMQSNFLVIMGICLVFMFFITMVITRIGASVGFEKGSKVTELILTSISRKQLYMVHVFSSFLAVLITMVIVYIPLIAAGCINDTKIAFTITGVSGFTWTFFVLHAIGTSFVLVILAIAITSIVKNSEDTGPYLLIVLIPFLISNIYFVVTGHIYKGMLSFLNYVPICSLIPSVGAGLLGKSDFRMELFMLLSDVVWLVAVYLLGEHYFKKNIVI